MATTTARAPEKNTPAIPSRRRRRRCLPFQRRACAHGGRFYPSSRMTRVRLQAAAAQFAKPATTGKMGVPEKALAADKVEQFRKKEKKEKKDSKAGKWNSRVSPECRPRIAAWSVVPSLKHAVLKPTGRGRWSRRSPGPGSHPGRRPALSRARWGWCPSTQQARRLRSGPRSARRWPSRGRPARSTRPRGWPRP